MFDWSEDYCIGVEKIDNQHRQLFKIAARIERIVDDGDDERSKRAVIEAIKYLEDYTLEHFSDEEAFQLENSYSGYDEHKKEHDNFKQTVLEYNNKLIDSDHSTEVVMKFVEVVRQWLVYHIMKSDQAISKEINSSKK